MTTDTASQEPTLKTAELGQAFTNAQIQNQCMALFGGVAWPGRRPGFAVVLALAAEPHFDGHDMILLDEPCSGLDPHHIVDISQLIRNLASG